MATRKQLIVGLLLLLLTSHKSMAVNSIDIVTSATTSFAESSCLSLCLTGFCVWLDCGLTGCYVEISLQFKYNNPDLVVTVYDELGEDPWTEMNFLTGEANRIAGESILGLLTPISLIGGGHQTEGSVHPNLEDKSLRFKEGSAYGHPLADALGETGLFCPSQATMFVPYFLSGVDAGEWRFGVREMFYPAAFTPLSRIVGSGMLNRWESVFPRTGFILQKDDPKGGAVIAQRIGNIVTGETGLHIRQDLVGPENNDYRWTTWPGELMENDPESGVWQMVEPLADDICYAFGENDVYNPLPWSTDRTADDNAYTYTLWRPYECCKDEGSHITTVSVEICL